MAGCNVCRRTAGSMIASSKWLFRLLFILLVLASAGQSSAWAGSLIEFPAASGEATPARAFGYLARPDAGLSAILSGHLIDSGPYPAIIVLHGCGGFSSHSAEFADLIGSWGYVALAVDSLTLRGITTHCGGGEFVEQVFDAYGALRYLARQDFVDGQRVAVLG